MSFSLVAVFLWKLWSQAVLFYKCLCKHKGKKNNQKTKKPRQPTVEKTSILQIQSEVYWSTLMCSSENYILGWSKYELIPAQVSLHGYSYCKCVTSLWKELLKWKIKLYINKSTNIFFQLGNNWEKDSVIYKTFSFVTWDILAKKFRRQFCL